MSLSMPCRLSDLNPLCQNAPGKRPRANHVNFTHSCPLLHKFSLERWLTTPRRKWTTAVYDISLLNVSSKENTNMDNNNNNNSNNQSKRSSITIRTLPLSEILEGWYSTTRTTTSKRRTHRPRAHRTRRRTTHARMHTTHTTTVVLWHRIHSFRMHVRALILLSLCVRVRVRWCVRACVCVSVLADPRGCAAFMKYLSDTMSTENLLFWLEVCACACACACHTALLVLVVFATNRDISLKS